MTGFGDERSSLGSWNREGPPQRLFTVAWLAGSVESPHNRIDKSTRNSLDDELYWAPRSRSFSALWLMEETGQPYERVLTDISSGGQKKPEYLAINPMGKVPALRMETARWRKRPRSAPKSPSAIPRRSWRRRRATPCARICTGCSLGQLHRARDGADRDQDRDDSVAAGWGDAQRVFDVLDNALEKGP